VGPGWFDANAPDQHRIVLLQGDRRNAGDPSDGMVARRQIAQALARSLTSEQALRKSFELVAETARENEAFDALFASLDADRQGALDGVRDLPNMPLDEKPQSIRDELAQMDAHSLPRTPC
jgi:hypothetical protein